MSSRITEILTIDHISLDIGSWRFVKSSALLGKLVGNIVTNHPGFCDITHGITKGQVRFDLDGIKDFVLEVRQTVNVAEVATLRSEIEQYRSEVQKKTERQRITPYYLRKQINKY